MEWVVVSIFAAAIGWQFKMLYSHGRKLSRLEDMNAQLKRLVSHYESERRSRTVLGATVREYKDIVMKVIERIDRIVNHKE